MKSKVENIRFKFRYMKQSDFYIKLLFLLEISSDLYSLYVKSGHKYLYAKSLYQNNIRIYSYILGNIAYMMEGELRIKTKYLIIHYLNWFNQFKLVEKSLGDKINENQKFVFAREQFDIPFPKEVVSIIAKRIIVA